MDNTIQMQLPDELQQAISRAVDKGVREAVKQAQERNNYRPYMTKQEAAKYLHVAPGTINKWPENIPAIEINGLIRYKRSDIDEFMAQHRTNK